MTKIADKKELIAIPNNVKIIIEDDSLTVKGEKGSLSRIFSHPNIDLKIKGNNIELKCSNPKRKEKALVGTFIAHIKNMIKGVTEEFEYKMKTVFSHFPIKTSAEGDYFVIQNFLGERSPRKAKILENVEVAISGDNITVSGIDKEKVGQTVANIERSAKIKHRDVRVFQDGVYLISKRG